VIATYAVPVTSPAVLSETESQAWLGLMHTHARLARQLDGDLEAVHRLSVIGFEVLSRVAGADLGRLRMTRLADLVMLSPSGLSRLVDRLCAQQLLERVACDSDGRAVYASITKLGRTRLEEARETMFTAIRERFLAYFTAEEVDQMARFWTRVSAHCS
jgi:DNA-binding MarR family transcriptional regulator